MPETTDIFEVMSTMRAMRRLKPDAVPNELINKILQAAQWAPSGGNSQRWRFLVTRTPRSRRRFRSTISAYTTNQSDPATLRARHRPAPTPLATSASTLQSNT
jgi:nitroreductase